MSCSFIIGQCPVHHISSSYVPQWTNFELMLNRKVKCNVHIQGVPKKVSVKPIFEFQTLGGVFLGVKNNSKNFGNKKNSRLLSKIWSK